VLAVMVRMCQRWVICAGGGATLFKWLRAGRL